MKNPKACKREFEILRTRGVIGMRNDDLQCQCSLDDIDSIECPGYVPSMECILINEDGTKQEM